MIIGSFINRVLSLNRGFITLKNDNNYLAALPLVRMQSYNCIRLFAYNCFENRDSYVKWAISGERLSKQNDFQTNEKLTDTNVLKKMDETYPLTESLYKKLLALCISLKRLLNILQKVILETELFIFPLVIMTSLALKPKETFT